MKKAIIFLSVIIVLFAAIAFVTKLQQSQKAEGNPYGKQTLDPATIDLLDDPNYQNIILPEQLDEKIKNKDDFTVYFFSPKCEFCLKTTPVLMPLAKELGEDVKQFNLEEFGEGWKKYGIEHTPTLIRYENGKEKARTVGYHDKGEFQQWFAENIN